MTDPPAVVPPSPRLQQKLTKLSSLVPVTYDRFMRPAFRASTLAFTTAVVVVSGAEAQPAKPGPPPPSRSSSQFTLRRDEVGGTRAQGRQADAGLAGQTAIGGGHEAGGLLVASQHQLDLRLAQRLEQVEVLFTWNTEHVLDAFIFQTLHYQSLARIRGGRNPQFRKVQTFTTLALRGLVRSAFAASVIAVAAGLWMRRSVVIA